MINTLSFFNLKEWLFEFGFSYREKGNLGIFELASPKRSKEIKIVVPIPTDLKKLPVPFQYYVRHTLIHHEIITLELWNEKWKD